MVHRIGNTCCGLFLRYCKCIDRVQNGDHRKQQRVDITYLVIGLGTRNHASAIIFGACSGKSDDIHDRQCSLGFYLIGNQIPWITVVLCACGNGLGTVKYAAAAYGQDYIHIMFLAEPDSVENARVILRIWLDTREFHDVITLQHLQHLLVQTDFLDASSTVCEKNLLSEPGHHLRQLRNRIPTENKTGRRHIIKILHRPL